MLAIDRVVDLAVTDQLPPDERALPTGASGDLLAAMTIYLDGAPARDLPDLAESVADRTRRTRRGLPDVDLPVGVERVRQIDADAGQLGVLLLLRTQT